MNLNNLFKKDIKLIKDSHRYEHVEDPNFEFIRHDITLPIYFSFKVVTKSE